MLQWCSMFSIEHDQHLISTQKKVVSPNTVKQVACASLLTRLSCLYSLPPCKDGMQGLIVGMCRYTNHPCMIHPVPMTRRTADRLIVQSHMHMCVPAAASSEPLGQSYSCQNAAYASSVAMTASCTWSLIKTPIKRTQRSADSWLGGGPMAVSGGGSRVLRLCKLLLIESLARC